MNDVQLAGQMNQMISGYWTSQAVYVAAKLGLADLVAAGPRTIDDLAAATGAVPDRLFRVLRALASVGVFTEASPRTFGLTPLAELLRSDATQSQRSLAIMMGEEHYFVWGQLLDMVRSEENAFEKLHGLPIFDYLGKHPEKGRVFDEAMTGIHGRETAAVIAAYDFSDIGVLADIGGGNGSKITAILQHFPSLRGMLFDLPHVVDRSEPRLREAGVLDRCELQRGNFFDSVPAGADAYLMRHIIHDWNDEQSLTILRNCHRAMQPGQRLLLVESVIPPGNGAFHTKFLDLTMMLIPGGRERTEDEYRQLYDQAGFDLRRIVPTSTEISIIEGVRR